MTRPIVIVGASLAGLRAAQAIRTAGHAGPIVVVGDEPHLPYTRPPLSKELLAGEQEAEQCALPSAKVDVEWRLSTRAVALDLAAREVEAHRARCEPPLDVDLRARQRALLRLLRAGQQLLRQRRARVGQVLLVPDHDDRAVVTGGADRLRRPQARERRADDDDRPRHPISPRP